MEPSCQGDWRATVMEMKGQKGQAPLEVGQEPVQSVFLGVTVDGDVLQHFVLGRDGLSALCCTQHVGNVLKCMYVCMYVSRYVCMSVCTTEETTAAHDTRSLVLQSCTEARE